jgi:hypothetical protein
LGGESWELGYHSKVIEKVETSWRITMKRGLPHLLLANCIVHELLGNTGFVLLRSTRSDKDS